MKTMATAILVTLLGAVGALAQVNIANRPPVKAQTRPEYIEQRYDKTIWSSNVVPPKDRHLSTLPWVAISDPHQCGGVVLDPVQREDGLVLFRWAWGGENR